MNLNRRLLLQASIGTGLLGSSTALIAGTNEDLIEASDPTGPVLLLRSGNDETFAQAVRRTALLAGAGRVDTMVLEPGMVRVPGALRASLEKHRGATLLALADDFTGTLLEECLRDLDAAIPCRGRHHGAASGASDSRHLFTTTARTRGVGAALAAALATGTGAYLVREQALSASETGAIGTQSRLDAQRRLEARWAQAIGTAYALMALGRWQGGAAIAQLGRGALAIHRDAQPQVSLLATL